MSAGLKLPGYADLVLIGQGGLGRVYCGIRMSTGGVVAIKELQDIAAASPAWHRARRELDAMLRLKGHPYVVSVEEIVDGPNGPCIVMEHVAGGSLMERLADGPLPSAEAVLVGQQVSQALLAAHESGIVHRDVKPHNLLIGSFGQVKVCDFGIASLARGMGARTQTQALTLGYASPEELDGDTSVGPAADVYSFAATMAHLLSGRKPSFQERLNGMPTDFGPSASHPAMVALLPVLHACMAHHPVDRPSMPDVVRAFDDASYRLGAERLSRLAMVTVESPTVYRQPQPSTPTPFDTRPTAAQQAMMAGDTVATARVRGMIAPPPPIEPATTFVHQFQSPPSQPSSHRGVLWALLGLGLGLAVAAGVLLGTKRSGTDATAESAVTTASPAAVVEPSTAGPVAEVGDAVATTVLPADVTVAPTVAPPLPPLTVAPATVPPPVAPAIVPPILPGELFVSRPITQPPCDGSFVTMVGASVDPALNAGQVQILLDQYPSANYLLTETTCPSLNPRTMAGALIYSVYFGPFASFGDACAARAAGPSDAYVRVLDTTTSSTTRFSCG